MWWKGSGWCSSVQVPHAEKYGRSEYTSSQSNIHRTSGAVVVTVALIAHRLELGSGMGGGYNERLFTFTPNATWLASGGA